MKKSSLVLVLLSSRAFAQEAGRAHPLAPECSATDADCIAAHDARVMTIATWMGVASYCRASTAPAPCFAAVAMINDDSGQPKTEGPDAPEGVIVANEKEAAVTTGAEVLAKPKANPVAAGKLATTRYVDFSAPADSEPESETDLPDVSKKGAL